MAVTQRRIWTESSDSGDPTHELGRRLLGPLEGLVVVADQVKHERRGESPGDILVGVGFRGVCGGGVGENLILLAIERKAVW